MTTTITGTLFDGETLAGRPVCLAVTAGRIHDTDGSGLVDASLSDLHVSDRLGDIPRYLYLPGGRTVATPDNDAVDTFLSSLRRGRLVALVHALEGRHQAAAAATMLLVAAVAFTIWWALPVLARQAAMAVPTAIEERAGQVSLATLQRLLAPSQLSRADRARVQTQADRLIRVAGIKETPKLVFLSMGGQFPNAFALPGGLVVVSDELVRLANHDEEIAAVLAHEFGHWRHRHGLQSVLRHSTALLVVSTVTGDLSTLTTFAGTIPFLLLQRGYAREFETEADAYALDLLRRAGIDTRFFRSILRKLEESRPQQGNDFTYLSTHPGTEDRIRTLGNLPPGLPPDARPRMSSTPGTPSDRIANVRPTVFAGARSDDSGVTLPRPLYQPSPAYSMQMLAARLQGEAIVEFVVDENGRTRDLRIVRSTYKEFEEPALDAIRQWRFEPARKDGQAVSFLARQLLEFTLHEPQSPRSTIPGRTAPSG